MKGIIFFVMVKTIIFFVIVAVAVMPMFAIPFMQWRLAQRDKQIGDSYEKLYGALGKTTEEILSRENPTNGLIVFGALQWRIGQKADAHGEGCLTDTERRLLAVSWVETVVNTEGFDEYFLNSAGDNAEAALAGLKDMGADDAAALLERAMAVFPGGMPPADRSKRQTAMEGIASQSKPVWDKCDEEFYKLKDSIDNLSLAYAKRKRTEIVLPCP
jgi:hypothetical protein